MASVIPGKISKADKIIFWSFTIIVVSWRIECSTPYPMNIVKLFGVIEKNMNKDFTEGLDKLKMICEQ